MTAGSKCHSGLSFLNLYIQLFHYMGCRYESSIGVVQLRQYLFNQAWKKYQVQREGNFYQGESESKRVFLPL